MDTSNNHFPGTLGYEEARKRSNSPSREKDVTKKKDAESTPGFKPKVVLPAHMEPTFYIGGGNGVAIVEEILLGLGWRRTKDKSDDNYRFRWTELKSQINYNKFREGEQVVNHIPNCNLLTNKLGLLNSLQEYERVCITTKKRAIKLDFLPETYRLDEQKDRELFLETYKEGETWICKPTGRNQGKGIFLVRNPDEIQQMIQEKEDKKDEGKPTKPLNRIIQRYIHNPLLINGRKFDLRCYMLVASTMPYLVLYHSGYVRLSMVDYDNDSDNLIAHLTNQFIQKKDPTYQENKEDTAWSMLKFNDYINENIAEEKGLPKDWLLTTFESRAKQILTHVFQSVKTKFQRRIGYFDLYGVDFMIDEEMKIWLIEINVNPCLATNCEALKEAIPPIVKETIYVAVECFEKSRRNRPIFPLQSLKNFQILVNESPKRKAQDSSPSRNYHRDKRAYSASPVRRSNNSPIKEPSANYQDRTSAAQKQRQSGPFARNTTKPTPTTLEPVQNSRVERRPATRPGYPKRIDESKENPTGSKDQSDNVAKEITSKDRDGSKSKPVLLTLSKAKVGGVSNSKISTIDISKKDVSVNPSNVKSPKMEKAKSSEEKVKNQNMEESNNMKEKTDKKDDKKIATDKKEKKDDKHEVKEKKGKKDDDKGAKDKDKKNENGNKKETKDKEISGDKIDSKTDKDVKEKEFDVNDEKVTLARKRTSNSNVNNNVVDGSSQEIDWNDINNDNLVSESDEKSAAIKRQKDALSPKDKKDLKLTLATNKPRVNNKSPYNRNNSSPKPASITLKMSNNHSDNKVRSKSKKEEQNRGS